MFWCGTYIMSRELKVLLVTPDVTLTQVLEADDILQECSADNEALSQFLTRPDILAELITLITEEPPKDVKLSLQYRHANIAAEVLNSNLSLLRDRLSCNAVQINRLCDFVNKEPPLNPLLASYFSKTIGMLLSRSLKMDYYLDNIVCIRVLEFFESRKDFLPNLLRHISTSAICDTVTCFLQTNRDTNVILKWLDEYQFLDCLIQIMCGTYDPEEPNRVVSEARERTTDEPNERLDSNHNSEEEKEPAAKEEAETNGECDRAGDGAERGAGPGAEPEDDEPVWQEPGREERLRRMREVAAANVADLLCDMAIDYALDPLNFRKFFAGHHLAKRLHDENAVRRVLQTCFTGPARARRSALVHTCRLTLALLHRTPAESPAFPLCLYQFEHEPVERAVAPHLPLLHRALLKDAVESDGDAGSSAPSPPGARPRAVGAVRVQVAALVAQLALSELDDVPTALMSLGTAGVLIELCFSCPHNNFLHAELVSFVRNARRNRKFADRYTKHLIEECDLLTRLMDAFEENEPGNGAPRASYMGHVVLLLREMHSPALALPPGPLLDRWTSFTQLRLEPLLALHDAPLGGVYPGKDMQEMESSYGALDDGHDFVASQFPETGVAIDEEEDDRRAVDSARNNFFELAGLRFDDNMWDDADEPEDLDEADEADQEARRVLEQTSPWESVGATGADGDQGGQGDQAGEGWAQFDSHFTADPFWGAPHDPESPSLTDAMQSLRVGDDDKDALTILLAHKMLAFNSMAPGHDPFAPDDRDLPPLDPEPDVRNDAASEDRGDGSGAAER